MSCPDCFKGSVHDDVEPKGTLHPSLNGYKTYVALPPSDSNPKSTIIFITDAFGLFLPNNKILADHYANSTGCRVLVPDIIPGGACPLWVMNAINNVFRPIGDTWRPWLNPVTYLDKAFNIGKSLVGFVPFLIRADAAKAYPSILKYTREIRKEMPADGKLGVAGFCWGGFGSTKLCTEADGGKALIDAQFNAHPSGLKVPDMVVDAVSTHKVPYSCAVAEFDFMFNKDAAGQAEAAVKQKVGSDGVYEFVIHKGMHHGFSVRASHDEGSEGRAGEDAAAKQAVDWFNKYLK